MKSRQVDWGKIAVVLTGVIVVIFVIDFGIRLFHDWRGDKGKLRVESPSSQVDSLSDSSLLDIPPEQTGTESSDSGTSVNSTAGALSSVQVSSDSIHTGSLILVDDTHPLVGTPETAVFKDFDYAHIRLVSTYLKVNTMIPSFITGWFTKFYEQTSLDNVLVYCTTEEPATVTYGTGIPERAAGLSLDLGAMDAASGSHGPITGEGEYGALATLAPDYGFVLRYPADKSAQTGHEGMTSHFRFVGTPHARYMTDNSLCLEEYLELLRSHPWQGEHLEITDNGTVYEVYYVPADEENAATEIFYSFAETPSISGDNVGGFVVWGPKAG